MKRSILIPLCLLLYLGAMVWFFGLDGYRSGQLSAAEFYGIIGVTIAVIVLLHFHLKKRERLRQERLDDMKRASRPSDDDRTPV